MREVLVICYYQIVCYFFKMATMSKMAAISYLKMVLWVCSVCPEILCVFLCLLWYIFILSKELLLLLLQSYCIELWHANVKGKMFLSTKFLIMRFASIFCRPTCKKDDDFFLFFITNNNKNRCGRQNRCGRGRAICYLFYLAWNTLG